MWPQNWTEIAICDHFEALKEICIVNCTVYYFYPFFYKATINEAYQIQYFTVMIKDNDRTVIRLFSHIKANISIKCDQMEALILEIV